MVAYSKRMNDIKRLRGIQVTRRSQVTTEGIPLWVNYHSQTQDEPIKRQGGTKPLRSLGGIKLEPLLGAPEVSTTETTDVIPDRSLHTIPVKQCRPEQGENETERPVRHLTLTISMPAYQDEEEEAEEMAPPPPPSPELEKSKPLPLNHGKERPKRAKRMKLPKSDFDAIIEASDDNELIDDEENGEHMDIRESFLESRALLENKRRQVSLLRQAHYAQQTFRENNRTKIKNMAKRKFRNLPPIPNGKTPTLRYTKRDPVIEKDHRRDKMHEESEQTVTRMIPQIGSYRLSLGSLQKG